MQKISYVGLGISLPHHAWGASIEAVVTRFVEVLIDPLITLLFAAALLLFFWGLFKLMVEISNGGDGVEGKSHMLWGIVGMFIMFSVGGILGFISESIGADSTSVEVINGFK
jgi:hypothetical protein